MFRRLSTVCLRRCEFSSVNFVRSSLFNTQFQGTITPIAVNNSSFVYSLFNVRFISGGARKPVAKTKAKATKATKATKVAKATKAKSASKKVSTSKKKVAVKSKAKVTAKKSKSASALAAKKRAREKERAKLARLRERRQAAKLRERERAQRRREKEAERRVRARERAQVKKERQREKRQAARERARERKQAAKERAAAKKAAQLTPKQKRILKKYPDPKRPQQVPSGYNLFVKAKYPGVSSANKNAKAPDNMKKVAQQWKSLNATEKQKFKDRAKGDQDKYKKLSKNYDRKKSEKKWLGVITPLLEKRPPQTGYQGYVSQQLKGKKDVKSNMKKAAQQWKSMTQHQKQQHNDKFAKQYEQWRDQVKKLYSQ